MIRNQERLREDPVQRLTRENKALRENQMRLDLENDSLAHELVSSKIQLRAELDAAEDKAETLSKELFKARADLTEAEEEKKRLLHEVTSLKEVCRRELSKMESELQQNIKVSKILLSLFRFTLIHHLIS